MAKGLNSYLAASQEDGNMKRFRLTDLWGSSARKTGAAVGISRVEHINTKDDFEVYFSSDGSKLVQQ